MEFPLKLVECLLLHLFMDLVHFSNLLDYSITSVSTGVLHVTLALKIAELSLLHSFPFPAHSLFSCS